MRRHCGLIAAVLLYAPGVMACTACFGDPDSSQTQGMNAAIITLLLITFGVMLVAGGVVLQLMVRAQRPMDSGVSTAPALGVAVSDMAKEEA